MWLATTLGFFSVVCARKGAGEGHQPVDSSRMMIRARVRGHLEALIQRFPKELGAVEILESNHADYRFRILCPKATWAPCIAELTNDITYDNFKDASGRIHGQNSPYLDALHKTWATFARLK